LIRRSCASSSISSPATCISSTIAGRCTIAPRSRIIPKWTGDAISFVCGCKGTTRKVRRSANPLRATPHEEDADCHGGNDDRQKQNGSLLDQLGNVRQKC